MEDKQPKSGNGEIAQIEEHNPISITNPLDLPTNVFQAGLDRRKANRAVLIDWIRSALVEGRDYGSIIVKGVKSKPSLFKPGAEKICGMLGLIPIFPNLHKYEEVVLSGGEVKQIILKCELLNQDGQIIANGVGARLLEQDKGDLNKSLKMAAKSAMIDNTLRCAGLSEIFTQDIEDMSSEEIKVDSEDEAYLSTSRQIDYIGHLCDERYDTDSKRRMGLHLAIAFGKHELEELTKEEASELIDHLLADRDLLTPEGTDEA